MGQHFNADVILLADLPSDRSGLASKAPAPLTSIRVAVVHREVSPIASSKNTVVFYGEFCLIAAKVGPQIGSNAYRKLSHG